MPQIGWKAESSSRHRLSEHFEEDEIPEGRPNRITDPYYRDQDRATG